MTAGVDHDGNLHDENGQFVSIGTLFERERQEHMKDHEQERNVAKETAQRLEREVEQTALRLERVVEEQAVRIERGVQTALAAVSETARIHSDAHMREHVAHERIHAVEKAQVDKAEVLMNNRLAGMNEFRDALQDQSGRMVTREVFDQRTEGVDDRLVRIEKNLIGREAFTKESDMRDGQIALLMEFRSKAVGAGVVIALFAGVVGAAILRAFGG